MTRRRSKTWSQGRPVDYQCGLSKLFLSTSGGNYFLQTMRILSSCRRSLLRLALVDNSNMTSCDTKVFSRTGCLQVLARYIESAESLNVGEREETSYVTKSKKMALAWRAEPVPEACKATLA